MSKYYVEYGALQANGKRLIECETSALDAEKITEEFAREIADALNGRDAWKRERAEVEAARVPTHKKSSAVGNAAEMREALTNLTRYGESDIRQLEQLAKRAIDNDIYGGGILQSLCAAIREGKEALSAPARNCDKYNDEVLATQAFMEARPYNCYAWSCADLIHWMLTSCRKGEGDGK